MQILRAQIAIFLLAITGALPAFAEPVNQTNAQELAKKINDTGSDDSIKGSMSNGMRALTNLYDLNIPGAIRNGVKAYGQYKNSEELDKLKEKNEALESKMASGAKVTTAKAQKPYVSPFARLPKNFLYEGEAGKLAEQIETLSGISRAELYKTAVSIHTNAKSVSDPQFVPWAMKAFADFANSVPNEEFRESLLKAHGLAERLLENGTASAVIAKYQNMDEGEVKKTLATPVIPAKAAVAASPPKSSPAIVAPDPVAVAASPEPPALVIPSGENKDLPTSQGGIHQLHAKDVFLDNLINTAVNTKEAEVSLFQAVSAKIRQLSVKHGMGK